MMTVVSLMNGIIMKILRGRNSHGGGGACCNWSNRVINNLVDKESDSILCVVVQIDCLNSVVKKGFRI